MEYRRRRAKRRRRFTSARGGQRVFGRSNQRSSGSPVGALLVLLLTAALVYVLLATSVGTWLIGNVFKPLFGREVEHSPDPGFSLSPQETPSSPKSSENISILGLEMYALQMGVYSSESYAEGLVSSLKSLGAAGYCYEDGSNMRILASAYTTEAAANSVCERLRDQGYECQVCVISCNGLEIAVTASKEHMESIRTALEFAIGIINDLNTEVISFDAEERSMDYGRAIASEMLANLKNIRESFSTINEQGGMMTLLNEYYTKLIGYFTNFIATESPNRVEMSGRLKHLQLDTVMEYKKILEAMSAMAD